MSIENKVVELKKDEYMSTFGLGQLVEIGGAFRIPEVMKLSGAKLIEVGTTNKTYVSDYSQAINEATALLFSAHTSNYQIIGFTAEVSISELVSLGQKQGIPVFLDLTSPLFPEHKKRATSIDAVIIPSSFG
jgi:seryl-tRNA(Sec) selenium transferase